jgi:hypothetical protein
MTKEELLRVFKTLHRRYYFHPRTLARTLLSLSSLAEAKRVLMGGVSLLRMELLRADARKI